MERLKSLNTEIRVVINDGTDYFYLLKIVKEGYDVYCTVPRLGAHHSLHESGVAHFRGEGTDVDPSKQPPVCIMSGSAGTKQGNNFIVASLKTLDSASGICTVLYSSIDSLSGDDYRLFNRNIDGCFVIDATSFPKNTTGLEVGVWAIPERGEAKFRSNNPDISENMLFKADQCNPQIWIYARPF